MARRIATHLGDRRAFLQVEYPSCPWRQPAFFPESGTHQGELPITNDDAEHQVPFLEKEQRLSRRPIPRPTRLGQCSAKEGSDIGGSSGYGVGFSWVNVVRRIAWSPLCQLSSFWQRNTEQAGSPRCFERRIASRWSVHCFADRCFAEFVLVARTYRHRIPDRVNSIDSGWMQGVGSLPFIDACAS